MNKTVLTMLAAAAVVAVVADPTPRRGGRPVPVPAGQQADRVIIEQFPKPNRSTLPAPSVPGQSAIGNCFLGQRKWIVLETKYRTEQKWTEQLTFTWHVLLETATATAKDRDDQAQLAPYSYFTTAVSYQNIPPGTHAAGVCLPPSYLERFGEPRAIGIVVTNAKGDVIAGDCESGIQGIQSHPKQISDAFWNQPTIMNKPSNIPGVNMIERRQGLVDRSKTIWALVNPNDYEAVVQ